MPGASCAFRFRLAVELLKPMPMSASWFALTPLTMFGAAVLLCDRSWNCDVNAGAEVELEAGELDPRVLRRLEDVDAALVLRPEVLHRDRPPLLPRVLRSAAGRRRGFGPRLPASAGAGVVGAAWTASLTVARFAARRPATLSASSARQRGCEYEVWIS